MPSPAPRPAKSIADLLSSSQADCRIRPFATADEIFCRALFRELRAAQFAPLGLNDGLLQWMLDQQFDAQRLCYARQFPDAEHFVVMHAGVDVGRVLLTLQRSSPAFSDGAKRSPQGDTLHLIDFTIAASARRRGIGGRVIDRLAGAAHAVGATRFTLTVLQANDPARRLYERLGFVAVKEGVHVAMVRHLA